MSSVRSRPLAAVAFPRKRRRPLISKASSLRVGGEPGVDDAGCTTLARSRAARGSKPARREPHSSQVDACRAWIREHVRPTTTIRRNVGSSYLLKHNVEGWMRARGEERAYVSNGAFIIAALREGYVAERASFASLNAYFNMSRVKAQRVGRLPACVAADLSAPRLRVVDGGNREPWDMRASRSKP